MESNVSVKMFLRWKKNRCVIKHISSQSHLNWNKTFVWIQLINDFFVCVCMRLFTGIIMNGYYISVAHDTQSDYTHFFMCCSKCLRAATKKVRWHSLKIWALSHEAVVFFLSVSFLIRKHQTLLISHVVDPKVKVKIEIIWKNFHQPWPQHSCGRNWHWPVYPYIQVLQWKVCGAAKVN